MDSWSDKELQIMRVGGNKQMREFFKSQEFPDNLSIEEKYNSEAAALYRDRIKSLAAGEAAKAIPHVGYKPSAQASSLQAKPKQMSHMSPNAIDDDEPSSSRSQRSNLQQPRQKMESYGSSNNISNSQSSSSAASDEWSQWGASLLQNAKSATSVLAAKTAAAAQQLKQQSAEIDTQQLQSKATQGWSSFTGFMSQAVSTVAAKVQGDDQQSGFTFPRQDMTDPNRPRNKYDSQGSESIANTSNNASSQQSNRPKSKYAAQSSETFFADQSDSKFNAQSSSSQPAASSASDSQWGWDDAMQSPQSSAPAPAPSQSKTKQETAQNTKNGWSGLGFEDDLQTLDMNSNSPAAETKPAQSKPSKPAAAATTTAQDSAWNDDILGFGDSDDDSKPTTVVSGKRNAK
jgi:ADP-ribosylation factor GTPase-activating protein 1